MLWSIIALRCADCDQEITRVTATEPHFLDLHRTLVQMTIDHRRRVDEFHRIIYHIVDEGET